MSNNKEKSKQLGHFRNQAAERAYKHAYEVALRELPRPVRTMDVSTDYGSVRIYEFGKRSAASPIVLLPGRSSGVPMWGRNLAELANSRTVYACDAIGDAGLSVQTRVLRNAADQANWIEQVFQELDLQKLNLVGHSFGGWLAANYVVRYPKRAATLSLLEPVFVLQHLRLRVYLQATLAILPFLPQSFRDKMLSSIGGAPKIDRNDPIANMIAEASNSFITRVPQPAKITEHQLGSIEVPVYIALGGKSAMHDPVAAERVAKSAIQGVEVKMWPTGTHSLPMEFSTEIDRELLVFMDKHQVQNA